VNDLPEIDLVPSAPAPTGKKTLPNNAYETSPLSGSSMEQDYLSSSSALFNPSTPTFAIIHEKPEHRIAILLKAQGKDNRTIARVTGYTESWLSQLFRQPWARQRLINEIEEAGKDGVYELLRGEVTNSIHAIIEVRDTAGSDEKAVKLAASQALLDRFLGKPTQRVESFEGGKRNTDQLDPSKLDEELKQAETELARLTGTPTTTTQ
jgi:hypothetical protein